MNRQRHPGAIALCIMTACSVMAGCAGSSETTSTNPVVSGDMVPDRREIRLTPMTALNSAADDFGVAMPLDTTTLLFTSGRIGALGRHSIFYSRQTASGWTPPQLAVELNTVQSNGTPSITPDGNTLYFTGCDYGLGDCDLYRADVGPRGTVSDQAIPWTIPTNIGTAINGGYWDSQCAVSADGGLLYFSSDRPGGLGGRDIWISRRKDDGTWDRPFNAGERVNTAFDEITPWPAPDGQTLLFSSNGHPGLGGFDVFSATITPAGAVVANLGSPINSTADEICFSLSADGAHAFVASNRSGGSGGYDIYQVAPVPVQVDPFVVVRGHVRAPDGTALIGVVEVTDLGSGQHLGTFLTDPENASFAIMLPRGFNYALTAQAPGHLFSSRQVTIPIDLEHNADRPLDFALQPITGTIRLLVFFAANESNLERESSVDLDRLVRLLKATPSLSIEVVGHTDNVGEAEANLALSRARAQAVKSYLVGNRIKAERITVTGYGASQPIATNDNEDGRALNRRVEVRMLKTK